MQRAPQPGVDKQQASPTPEHAKQPRTERLPERASYASAGVMEPGEHALPGMQSPRRSLLAGPRPARSLQLHLVTMTRQAMGLARTPLAAAAAAAARLERSAGWPAARFHPPACGKSRG